MIAPPPSRPFAVSPILPPPPLRLELRLPLPPHSDAKLWRAMMSGLAHTYRYYTAKGDHEAALRALVNAVFRNRRAVRLEGRTDERSLA